MLIDLLQQRFSSGYRSSTAKTDAGDFMADGSENMLVTGSGKLQGFKGLTVKGGVTGSKVLMNAGDGYGGLGEHGETAIGSVFKVLGALFYIGAGKLYYNGTYQSDSASTTLSLKRFTSGSLGTEYQAGMAQPSAPTITAVTPPSGFSGKNNGVVSAQIARVRSQTGGTSNASLTSNVVTATNQSIAITFPAADLNGQDYWEIDVTKNGEGGLGNHFFLTEIAESVIAATVTASRISTSTTSIGVPNGTLTADNIGWQYTSSGDTTTYVTAVGAANSYSAGNQAITLNAASVLTNTQSGTFTRAVAGVTRTYVFEWKDADLVGSTLAPIRNFPPPAGVFGGVLEDVVFVDGCYGDTVNVTTRTDAQTNIAYSATNVGNAIAISDPNKPEAFPPDNLIFTGDGPTAILPGSKGVTWRFSQNSTGVIQYQGGSPALSYERVWTGIGIRNQHNACLGSGGRLYAYTGARGAVRLGLGGEPDTTFAADVADDMASWTPANVVLGYDVNNQFVFFMHSRTILAFYEPLGIWSAPLTIPTATVGASGVIRAAVTINGACYLSYDTGSAVSLYDFNVGNGTTGKVTTPWTYSPEVSSIISRVHLSGRYDTASNDVTLKIFTNGDYTTPKSTLTLDVPSTGFQPLKTVRPNIRNAKMWRAEISYTNAGGDSGPESIRVEGETQNITF